MRCNEEQVRVLIDYGLVREEADLAADWIDLHAENDRLRTEIGIGADAESLLSRSECWDRVWARLVDIDGGISAHGETLIDSALEVLNELVADRDALRAKLERAEAIVKLVRAKSCCEGDDAQTTAETVAALLAYDEVK